MKKIVAKEIMTREVKTVRPEMSIRELAEFLIEHKISGAPVLDPEGRLLGIVTEGDLIVRDAAVHLPTVITIFDAVIYLEDRHKYEKELHKIIGQTVRDIMSPNPLTITPETDLGEMATLMHERGYHLLPVMEAGLVVGIVGKADLVRAIAQEERG
jgi:CBS domain-containing protein